MRTFLLAFVIIGAATLAPRPAAADLGEAGPGVMVDVRASGLAAPEGTAVTQPSNVYAAATGTHFQVTYIGVPDDARAAVEYAVAIWEALIVSPVDITVELTWAELAPGLWGSAGFQHTYRNFPGAPRSDTWYPIPIANAIAGFDLLPGSADIVATFNENTDWYLSTDGQAPPGTADLVTLTLHELAHGLGFGATFDVAGLLGKWRGDEGKPFIYERYVQNGLGQGLIDTGIFPNPSIALGTQLRSGSLFFNGPETVAANGGIPARLYAPETWEGLSSVQHLDEDTFPTGDQNSLMTPFFDFGEVMHTPGSITLALLRDLGWETSAPEACLPFGAGALGNGTVKLAPHASPGCATGFYAPGEAVTMVAIAGEGWTHMTWSLSVGEATCTGCATETVTMPNTGQTAIATFETPAFSERLVLPQTVRSAVEP